MKNKQRIEAICKGQNNIEGADGMQIDANAIIIGNFLIGYVPVEEYGQGVEILTTDDIISALSDMAELSQADVNRVLAILGYKPGRNTAGSFGWLLKPIGR